MKQLILFLFSLCCAAIATAQQVDDQLLVFRNTGDVELFFTSELDSIVVSRFDADNVQHETYVSQVYYARDTTMFIPIQEIDSVCFGNRNVIEFHKDVHEILPEIDEPWITSIIDNSITYASNTPPNILPKIGEKFYAEADDVFPRSVGYRIVSSNFTANGFVFEIAELEPSDIFSRHFYAGRIGEESTTPLRTNSRRRALDIQGKIELKNELTVEDVGSCHTSLSGVLKGKVISNILKEYYDVTLDLSAVAKMGFELASELDYKKKLESNLTPPITICTLAKVIDIRAFLSAFCDIDASLKFKYDMERKYTYSLHWTHRQGKKDIFNCSTPKSNKDNDVNTAKAEVTLDGSLFLGPMLGLDLVGVGECLGVRGKVKLGPKLSGNLSLGVISDLSQDYNADLYAKGEIKFKGRLEFNSFLLTRENIVFGKKKETKFGTFSMDFGGYTLNMFPKFNKTKAVKEPVKNSQRHNPSKTDPDTQTPPPSVEDDELDKYEAVTRMMDKVNKLYQDIEEQEKRRKYGFAAKLPNSQVFYHCVCDSSKQVEKSDSIVPLKGTIKMPRSSSANGRVMVYPTFTYMGKTLLAAPVSSSQDISILPINMMMSNGPATIISGAQIIAMTKTKENFVNVGNYLPVYVRDTMFVKDPRIIEAKPSFGATTIHLENSLVGTWSETDVDHPLVLTFDDNEKGKLIIAEKDHPFTYLVDYPSAREILLRYEDNTSEIFIITDFSNDDMTIRFKKNNKEFVLLRQKEE